MFPYEKEWFKLKEYIFTQERLSKSDTMDKMTELEIIRLNTQFRSPGKILPLEETE